MTSILTTIELDIAPIVADAKAIVEKGVAAIEAIVPTIEQKAVALIKETHLGTQIENLIEEAELVVTATGTDKFEAIVKVATDAYDAFVGADGLSGLIAEGLSEGTSVLRQLIQVLYDEFKSAV